MIYAGTRGIFRLTFQTIFLATSSARASKSNHVKVAFVSVLVVVDTPDTGTQYSTSCQAGRIMFAGY